MLEPVGRGVLQGKFMLTFIQAQKVGSQEGTEGAALHPRTQGRVLSFWEAASVQAQEKLELTIEMVPEVPGLATAHMRVETWRP